MIACVPCVRGVGSSSDLNALFYACARLTPRIERHPDALVLDLSSCERLILACGPSRPVVEEWSAGAVWPLLAAAVYRRLCASSTASATSPDAAPGLCLVLASTRTAAWLAALAATVPALPSSSGGTSWRVLVPERVAAFLRPLPAGVLASLPELRGACGVAEALEALAQSGIGTLGSLARIPASALRRHFGPLSGILATLATGQDVAPLCVWRPPAWIGARHRFDAPVEAAQLPPGALALLARRVAGAQARSSSSAAARETAPAVFYPVRPPTMHHTHWQIQAIGPNPAASGPGSVGTFAATVYAICVTVA